MTVLTLIQLRTVLPVIRHLVSISGVLSRYSHAQEFHAQEFLCAPQQGEL
ncbi:MAG: hypothetical protein WBA57_05110 [Elainellaceae cyanobacterium]